MAQYTILHGLFWNRYQWLRSLAPLYQTLSNLPRTEKEWLAWSETGRWLLKVLTSSHWVEVLLCFRFIKRAFVFINFMFHHKSLNHNSSHMLEFSPKRPGCYQCDFPLTQNAQFFAQCECFLIPYMYKFEWLDCKNVCQPPKKWFIAHVSVCVQTVAFVDTFLQWSRITWYRLNMCNIVQFWTDRTHDPPLNTFSKSYSR